MDAGLVGQDLGFSSRAPTGCSQPYLLSVCSLVFVFLAPPFQPGSDSAPNWSPKAARPTSSMNPSWSQPRAPPGEDRSHSSQHSPHHLPPSFLLNSKGLTSAPAKPWQLWKLRGFLWGVHRSLRRAQLPSQGASSRNVFLIFIVHSVCYRCVHCNYSNSLHMCCYAMEPFKLCQVFSFFLSETQIYYFYLCFS